MSPRRSLQDWLADELTRAAAGRLRRRYPEWADAMVSEHANLVGEKDRFRWALGSLRASFNLPVPQDALYPALLLLSVTGMVVYQWSADESMGTLLVVSLLGLGLGFIRPRRVLISGVALGVVVTAVNGFETLSGIRPAYEINAHSLLHALRWLVFVLPALVSSALGRELSRKLIA